MPPTQRRSFLADLSWFQVVAGALAAMTSAWLASTLGVGGTIIGAALGSLVVAVSSAFYAHTLDRGRTLIVQTEDGRRVETHAEPGETAEALADVAERTGSPVQGAEVVNESDPRGGIRWKAVVVLTVAALAVAGLAMGAYELATDRAWGSNPDNARIGNPFGGGSQPDPTPTAPTGEPTDVTPTEPTPTETAEPEPTPTATAEPTTEPTPTVEPTPTPTPTP